MSEVIERIQEAAIEAERLGAGMWITSKCIQVSLRSGFVTGTEKVSYKDLQYHPQNPLTNALKTLDQHLKNKRPTVEADNV